MKFFLIFLVVIIFLPVLAILLGTFLPSKTVTNYEQAIQRLPMKKEDEKKKDSENK